MDARSQNYCWRGKEMSIMYSECVFVALVTQHAKSTRHIAICGLSGSKKIMRTRLGATDKRIVVQNLK
jgi:hypothetical protein